MQIIFKIENKWVRKRHSVVVITDFELGACFNLR